MNSLDGLEDIIGRAKNLGGGCGFRGDRHQVSFARWNLWALVLTTLSAVFSGAAGATLLASAQQGSTLAYVGGGFGVAAAILVTVNTQVAPQARADRHEKAAIGFSVLAGQFFQLEVVATNRDEALAQLITLTTQRDQLDQGSPRPEIWTQKKIDEQRQAKKRRETGAKERQETQTGLRS